MAPLVGFKRPLKCWMRVLFPVELLHGLRQDGFDVPLDALGIGECAEAIVQALA